VNLDDKSIFDFYTPKTNDSSTLNDGSEFEFDQPEPGDFINLDNEIVDLAGLNRLMECVCPKCGEKTEVDLALMPENGFVITCSSCNKNVHIIRESCACRAKRKSYEINCANCGKLLDQQPHCQTCGKIFPDYFVTFNPDDARRKTRNEFFYNKWAAIRDLEISFRPTFKGKAHDVAPGYSPVREHFDTSTGRSALLSRRFAIIVTTLIVMCALVAAGIFAFDYQRSGLNYAENYIKALYCIKTGIDSNVNSCTSLKTEWESATASGKRFSPRISNYDETKSGKLGSEIDKYLQKLSKPPKGFSRANENLTKIHNIYLDSEALVRSRPTTLQELNISLENLNKKMRLASQDLKSDLPDSLKKEMEQAKLKYRGMKDF
jgi:hypothetical protein